MNADPIRVLCLQRLTPCPGSAIPESAHVSGFHDGAWLPPA